MILYSTDQNLFLPQYEMDQIMSFIHVGSWLDAAQNVPVIGVESFVLLVVIYFILDFVLYSIFGTSVTLLTMILGKAILVVVLDE